MLWSRVVPVNEFHLVFKKLLQRKDTFFTYIQLFIVCVFCESIDIMARRSGVCEDTHFLVRYLCDDNLQVRSRAYFRCDSDVSISVGDEYDVQWGRPKDVDLAVVLFCGSEQEVRKRMQEMESLSEPLSPTPPQSPLSPSPPASPAPKRKKIPKSQVSKLSFFLN